MEQLTVVAQVPAKAASGDKPATPLLGPVTIVVKSGKTAAEMIQMFGDEAVKSNAEANWKVTLQANIRAGLKKGETADQISTRLASAKMGVAATGAKVDPVQAYLAQFASATPDKQKEMLAELQKRAAKK